ncbi:glycosyltransferase family 2 protein [Vibrio cholerae]|uniref:glycosyltransferase family 2 protein n=1 Tax=Vibrio cholerae TaxID=666 RepID=UPI00148C7F56|nr:glycosyltransferase family A protein [Vibrio cholerae]NOE83720.1 glycosyltransferase family 2 protein [Vibrio cholerae]NOE95197.1 glycosyltransferase family 2 protein [Vibrio cholerae]NOE99902.1 glycosyltransferase family 2 protein [Vibrio cholerae]NOF12907.1 glycosyltransferase family 2 protein [Vibrio cholerae]NOF15815.1 glycosyltransferase family 2 protein [Vibrio cholerae]
MSGSISGYSAPKVSVIMPVYNTELYVERAIISLMEQTLDDVQFIIIDDGSNDNSLSIIKEVITRYPIRKDQITLISRENRGVAATRAQGMELATGDYVIHLDSDDWAERNWLEEMYTKAIHENADMVVCDYSMIYKSKQVPVNMPPAGTGEECLKQLLCDKQRGYTWNKLVSREIINKVSVPFVVDINYLEDLIYIAKCFLFSRKISYVPLSLYCYNQENVISITKLISESKKQDIKAAVSYMEDFILKHNGSDSLYNEVLTFKILQKTFLIYGEWEGVNKSTWQVFPETNTHILASKVAPHFKISMMIANLKLYRLASFLMKLMVQLKLIISSQN